MLTTREIQILKMRLDQRMPLKEIAQEWVVTPIRIRGIQDKAIRKLWKLYKENNAT